jgi:hypothetical protein
MIIFAPTNLRQAPFSSRPRQNVEKSSSVERLDQSRLSIIQAGKTRLNPFNKRLRGNIRAPKVRDRPIYADLHFRADRPTSMNISAHCYSVPQNDVKTLLTSRAFLAAPPPD